MKTRLKWSLYVSTSIIGAIILLLPVVSEYILLYPLEMEDSHLFVLDIKHIIKIAFKLVVFSSIVHLPNLLLPKTFQRIYLGVLSLIIYLPSLLDFIHVCMFGVRFNESSYYTMFSTYRVEAIEFISNYSVLNLFFYLLIWIAIVLISFFLLKRIWHWKRGKQMAIVCSVLCWLFPLLLIIKPSLNWKNEASFLQMAHYYKAFKQEIKTLKTFPVNRDQPVVSLKDSLHAQETHFVVIGESTSTYHMGLYGYSRQTNPLLSKMRNELYIFNEVKSTYVHTIESLKDVFLLKDSNNKSTPITLMDCYNAAGFKTFWLSNQPFLGEYETPISAMVSRAHEKIYMSAWGAHKLDEHIFTALDGILKDASTKKIVFIHLMGCHMQYKNRYPHFFKTFDDEHISLFGQHADEYINHYDNAILYNDFIIHSLIQKLKLLDGMCSMVYFSDHGDEVYDFRNFHGHSQGIASKYMKSVPFIVWGNHAFTTERMNVLSSVPKNQHKIFVLGDLSHSLEELYGIRSYYYDRTKSYFCTLMDHNHLNASNMDTFAISVPEFPNFSQRIGIHRVNGIERLNEVQKTFNAFEIDAVFHNGTFDIHHPPAPSIHLSLRTFLEEVYLPNMSYIWLDLKNLNEHNKDQILETLNTLMQIFPIKNRLIVETTEVQLILDLNKAGYITSYYLPNLSLLSDEEVTLEVTKIAHNLNTYKPNAISQSFENYEIMNTYFKYYNKLIWALQVDADNNKQLKSIEKILGADKSIKACLIDMQTKNWR